MSLINDALKRAKDAQPKSPSVATGPEFRPAKPTPAAKISRGLGSTTPVIIVLIVCSGIILLLMWPRHKSVENSPVDIKAAARANPVPETKPPVHAVAISTPAATVKPAVVAPPSVPLPAPVPLKLQAIFFVPGHSSAIINGKTVRVGDSLQGFRVAAINQSSAKLVSATQTNVMTLEQ